MVKVFGPPALWCLVFFISPVFFWYKIAAFLCMFAKVLDLGLVSISLGFGGVLGTFLLLSVEKSSLFWFLVKSTNGNVACARGIIWGFLGCVSFSFCGFWALLSSSFLFLFSCL